jgi:hypothetical protein
MADRRERFRRYMARLSGAANPADTLKANLYVKQPGRSVADQISSRLELEPASSHLVVGGVGSGKTTQLLVAARQLNATPDVRAWGIDVSRRHDLTRLQTGVLLVLAGLAVLRRLTVTSEADLELKKAKRDFENWAHGWIEWVDDGPDDDWGPDDYGEPDDRTPIQHKGLLVPPEPALRFDIQQKADQLKVLQREFSRKNLHPVILFDSLDRLSNARLFNELVMQDVRAIRSAGIGVVVVGPLQLMFRAERAIADRFDYFYHQPSVDVAQDPEGRQFLLEVLGRRAEPDILSQEAASKIVYYCGGVLRDLISIARASGEEAYTRGAELVTVSEVESAADTFGRTLMLGIDVEELKVLQKIRTTGTFVPTSDKDLALLLTRRVLEYGVGQTRFAVHPTIAPLLEQMVQQ